MTLQEILKIIQEKGTKLRNIQKQKIIWSWTIDGFYIQLKDIL